MLMEKHTLNRNTYESDIKIYLTESVREDWRWMKLAQNRAQWNGVNNIEALGSATRLSEQIY